MDHPYHRWIPGAITAGITGGYALLNRALSVKAVHKRMDELKANQDVMQAQMNQVVVESRTSNEMLKILVQRKPTRRR